MLKLYDENNREITYDSYREYCENPDCLGEPWCTAWGICKGSAQEPQQTASQMIQETSSDGGCDQELDQLFLELSQQADSTFQPAESSATPFLESAGGLTTHQQPNQQSSSSHYSEQQSSSVPPQLQSSSGLPVPKPASKSARQFAEMITDEEIEQIRTAGIPSKTKQDTKYCIGLWDSWAAYREDKTGKKIQPIQMLSRTELQYLLSRFILEVRKKDGTEFPPNTLHHIVAGIMRYLRWNGHSTIDFFADKDFTDFKNLLDAEMKRLQAKGLGSTKRQAEPLTQKEEELLWQKGLLGGDSPQTLLNTMVFCNGLYFALRSGREHRQLRLRPCQIQLIENEGERPFLRYTEDVSKNRPGGIKGRKVKPKVVIHHANTENPERCFVQLFKKYVKLCPNSPTDMGSFYLQPSTKPTENCWYTSKPLGHNSLTKTMSRMCTAAGIKGFKTNHSLRATTATRLYQSGVDEQLVMERTGHRSIEGVRSYKRTSDEQREALSDILNKRPKITLEDVSPPQNSHSEVVPFSPKPIEENKTSVSCSPNQQDQRQVSTHLSNIQTNTNNNNIPGTFIFNSCSSVTFNIKY